MERYEKSWHANSWYIVSQTSSMLIKVLARSIFDVLTVEWRTDFLDLLPTGMLVSPSQSWSSTSNSKYSDRTRLCPCMALEPTASRLVLVYAQSPIIIFLHPLFCLGHTDGGLWHCAPILCTLGSKSMNTILFSHTAWSRIECKKHSVYCMWDVGGLETCALALTITWVPSTALTSQAKQFPVAG